MSDDLYDEVEDDNDSGLVKRLRDQLKDQSRELKEANERLAKAASLERELAIRDAGLDLNNPQVKFFADNYTGDATAEAVKSKALEYGFLQSPTVPSAELEEHARSVAASAGAESPSPSQTNEAEYQAALRNCTSPEQVIAVMRQYRPDSVTPFAQ